MKPRSPPESDSRRMTRRAAIAGLFASAAMIHPLRGVVRSQSNDTLSPEMFGAVGDGVTDDWEALRDLVRAVNAGRGGIVQFGRGKTYRLNRFNRESGVDHNLVFSNCANLTIRGNGAKIDIKGDFDRDSAATHALTGLFLSKCDNVLIENLEIDGNVDRMTNSAGAGEPPSYGIRLGECSNVVLRNLDLHHHSSDGLLIRDAGATPVRRVCRSVRGENVKCRYNARQGMSVVALRNGTFVDCDFSWTGRDQGRYVGHSPQAGVDIEPGRDTRTAGTGRMDADTGDVSFQRCTFQENKGSQFVCGGSRRYDRIGLRDSTLIVGGGSTAGTDALIFGAPASTLENCAIDLGRQGKRLYLWPNRANDYGDFRFAGNRVSGNGELIRINGRPSGAISIEDNILTHTSDSTFSKRIWLLTGAPRIRLLRNRVFVPGAAYRGRGKSGAQIIFRTHVELAEGNIYETDLRPSGRASDMAHFANQYGPSTIARNERYAGTSPGPADTIRPAAGSRHDTRRSFGEA